MKIIEQGSDAVTLCHNLQPCADNPDVLCPVLPPIRVSDRPLRPLCSLAMPETHRRMVVCACDAFSLYAVDADFPHPADIDPIFIATLPAPIQHCASASYGLTVYTDEGVFLLLFAEGEDAYHPGMMTLCEADSQFSPLRIEATHIQPFTADIPARQLKTPLVGTSVTRLLDSDRNALRTDLADAYLSIMAQADAVDASVQPRWACYELCDTTGAPLFRSAPVLLMPRGGAQCADVYSSNVDVSGNVGAYSLSANAYKIHLCSYAAQRRPLDRLVASVRVLVSEQYHPDVTASFNDSGIRYHAGTGYRVWATMPGASTAMNVGDSESTQARVCKALGLVRFAEAAHIYGPMRHSADATYTIGACRTPYNIPSLSYNMDTYTCLGMASMGNTSLYAGLSRLPFSGYSPLMFAAEVQPTDADVTAYVKVQFNDGTPDLVRRYALGRLMPTTLNPVLSYPHPSAVSLTIAYATTDTDAVQITVPLTAVGSDAVYVSPDLQPLVPTPVSALADAPSHGSVAVDVPGCVAIGHSTVPTRIESVCHTGINDVVAVLPAVQSGGSWDFGRQRFYVLTTDAIYVANVSSDMRKVSVTRVLARGISSAACAALSPHGAIYVGCNDGSIWSVQGHKATSLGRCQTPALALWWHSLRRQLWCRTAPDSAQVFCIDMPRHASFTADVRPIVHTMTLPDGTVWACDNEALWSLTDTDASHPVSVAYTTKIQRIPAMGHAVVSLDMPAMTVDGMLSLYNAYNPQTARTLAEWLLSGRLAAPIVLDVGAVGPVKKMYAHLLARVSADALLNDISTTTAPSLIF